MYTYRVTKYDPNNRDENGVYLIDDWIGFSEVGEYFNNEELTFEKYLDIEQKYVDAVRGFFTFCTVETVEIRKYCFFEDDMTMFSADQIKILKKLEHSSMIGMLEVLQLVPLILRGHIYAYLVSPNNGKQYVMFGYDYYMYFYSDALLDSITISNIEKQGLYVELYTGMPDVDMS